MRTLAQDKGTAKPLTSVENGNMVKIECPEKIKCDIEISDGINNHEIIRYTIDAKWETPKKVEEPTKKTKLEIGFLDLKNCPDDAKIKKIYDFLVDSTLEQAIVVLGLKDRVFYIENDFQEEKYEI